MHESRQTNWDPTIGEPHDADLARIEQGIQGLLCAVSTQAIEDLDAYARDAMTRDHRRLTADDVATAHDAISGRIRAGHTYLSEVAAVASRLLVGLRTEQDRTYLRAAAIKAKTLSMGVRKSRDMPKKDPKKHTKAKKPAKKRKPRGDFAQVALAVVERATGGNGFSKKVANHKAMVQKNTAKSR